MAHHDISELELEALKAGIIDNAGYAIVGGNKDGIITLFNQAAESMLGYSSDEIVGQTTPEVFHLPEEIARRAEQFSRELGVHVEPGFDVFVVRARLGLPNKYEWTSVHKDGTHIPILLSVTETRDLSGAITGYLGVAAEITDLKHAEHELLESREQLNEAQRLAKLGSWTQNLVTHELDWSDEIFRIFEIDPHGDALSIDAFMSVIHPDDRDRVELAFFDSVRSGHPFELTHRLKFPDGRIKYVHAAGENVYDTDGKPVLSRGTVQDITDRKLAENKISLYANVFQNSTQGIFIIGPEHKIISVNPAAENLTGYTAAELVGQDPKSLTAGHTTESICRDMWSTLELEGSWQGELLERRKNGQVYPIWLSISALKNDHAEVEYYIATFMDISERKAAEEEIKRLAHHDTLTGLYNRFSLEERLGQAIKLAQRDRQQLAVLFIDMDRFKAINDTLGHHTGDKLLMEVASRLLGCVRQSDIVTRLGGDEFVVALTGLETPIAAADVAQKIIDKLRQNYLIDDHVLSSTPSIGVSYFPTDGEDVETLMRNADTAMYYAKEQGRNTCHFFTEGLNQKARERIVLEKDLSAALKNGTLQLHYQPQIIASSGKIKAVEALIRWPHPEQGMIPPDTFIPIAEEGGLIGELGHWVLDEACRQLADWRAMGLMVNMAINLSTKQLRDSSLGARISESISKYGISENQLEFEITETAAMSDPEHAIHQMQAIRNLGVNFAIDDFGTGYSSLAYLKLLPIQTLKLDRSFVRDLETDENDAAICIATISLAHSLGLNVIAEGVETEGQKRKLLEHGCDVLQGYLFCRPRPAGEITALLMQSMPRDQ